MSKPIELDREEMDIIFSAIEKVEKEGEAIIDRAIKMKAGETANEQAKFNKRLGELKTKFLHE